MANMLERVHLRTKHFIAAVDLKNRTWTLTGEFLHEVHTVADNPWEGTVLQNEIAELYDLEATIRSMFDLKKQEEGDPDGVQLHLVSETRV